MLDGSRQRHLSRYLFQAAVAAALLLPQAALACAARVEAIRTGAITYDPFTSAPTGGWIRVTAALVDGGECDATVALADGGDAPLRLIVFGGGGVTFRPELRLGTNMRSTADPTQAVLHLTTAAPRLEAEWRLVAVSEGVLSPGDHTYPIRASLQGQGAADVPAPGVLALHSVARAQVNLAGASSGFASGSDAATIDLGELVAGRTGHAVLQVRANTTARVSFRSVNRGFLVNAAAAGAKIPYSLTMAGLPVDLAGDAVRTVEAPTSLRGSAFDLDVTVGQFEPAVAGRYSDDVTIDVSP